MSTNNRQPLVGQRLRELREQLGLTRDELGTATGVNPSTIFRLEGGLDVRLSSYLPIIDYFIARDPTPAIVAERLVLLTPAQRALILEWLDHTEADGD